MRRSISTRERVSIFQSAGGLCHICGGRIAIGDSWDVEHVIPLAQGGEDGGENLKPAHTRCHKGKSAKDATDTARAKRREATHLGCKTSRNPLPGSRSSGWKKTFSNGWVKR